MEDDFFCRKCGALVPGLVVDRYFAMNFVDSVGEALSFFWFCIDEHYLCESERSLIRFLLGRSLVSAFLYAFGQVLWTPQ